MKKQKYIVTKNMLNNIPLVSNGFLKVIIIIIFLAIYLLIEPVMGQQALELLLSVRSKYVMELYSSASTKKKALEEGNFPHAVLCAMVWQWFGYPWSVLKRLTTWGRNEMARDLKWNTPFHINNPCAPFTWRIKDQRLFLSSLLCFSSLGQFYLNLEH